MAIEPENKSPIPNWIRSSQFVIWNPQLGIKCTVGDSTSDVAVIKLWRPMKKRDFLRFSDFLTIFDIFFWIFCLFSVFFLFYFFIFLNFFWNFFKFFGISFGFFDFL